MTGDIHEFGTDTLKAAVCSHGAEIQSLRDKNGHELLWQAGAQWPRHSPILFPVVGKPPAGLFTTNGRPTKLTQHGFARDREFTWIERTATGCILELRDDEATRALFPSSFSLRVIYSIAENCLMVRYSLHNPSSTSTLHAALGAHPAFVWPLYENIPKTDHSLDFEQPEPAPIRRLDASGLSPEAVPTPIAGRRLALDEALFADDAIIMPTLTSRNVHYHAADRGGLLMKWNGFRDLGLWMKPGADFLCIEPWYGFAAPADFRGDFADKPGSLHIAPGDTWHAFWSVETTSPKTAPAQSSGET